MPKNKSALTVQDIINAKRREKNYKLYDTGGLTLLVRTSGKKVWQYPYKLGGSNNIYTIGQYGTEEGFVGLKQARMERDVARSLVEKGINPNQIKFKEKEEKILASQNSFEAVAEEWMSKQTWAAKHGKNIKSRLEKDVFEYIGNRPITEVKANDIISILKRIEARDACDVAKRIGQYCSAIFDYGIINNVCVDNPALGRSRLVKAVERKNRPHLKAAELPDFMKKLNNYTRKPRVKLMVRLLSLTFLRPGELIGGRWAEIDVKNALWSIPAERMKKKREHLVPLSTQALDALKQLKTINGDSDLMFPSDIKPKQPLSLEGLLKDVKYFTDKKSVSHGFRHTASTALNESNLFNRDHIEKQLAHVHGDKIRGTYNKAEYLEERRKMMQWWSDHLDTCGKQINGENC